MPVTRADRKPGWLRSGGSSESPLPSQKGAVPSGESWQLRLSSDRAKYARATAATWIARVELPFAASPTRMGRV